MKLKSILTLATLATCQFALAAIPTAINYQGRLTDSDGNPASGTKVFGLEIYDAQTGGNAIYSETIGSVAIDANGIYNFQFGANGSSVVSDSEVIATTDGSKQVFNATLDQLPIDGSVSISDGTYTWSQSSGSSDPGAFTGSVTVGTGAISAIYLAGAPAEETEISASYNYNDSGISGALTTGTAHWLELTIDGDTQSPRERVLSVPFATVASSAVKPNINIRPAGFSSGWVSAFSEFTALPLSFVLTGGSRDFFYYLKPDFSQKAITSIRIQMREIFNASGGVQWAYGQLFLVSRENKTGIIRNELAITTSNNTSFEVFENNARVLLDWSKYSYYLQIKIGTLSANRDSGAEVKWVEADFEYAE